MASEKGNLMSDAVMPEVEYEVWQDGDWVAGSNDRADAEHYLTLYGQDGPVEAKTSFTYRVEGFTPEHALAASTPVGGWEDKEAEPRINETGHLWLASDDRGRVFPGVLVGHRIPEDAVKVMLIPLPNAAPPPPSVSIDKGSRPQEAVPTCEAEIARLKGTIELWESGRLTLEYMPDGRPCIMHHPEDPNAEVRDPDTGEVIFPAKKAPFRVIEGSTPQTADGGSSNEGAG